MFDPRSLIEKKLHGGFVVVSVDFSDEALFDAMGRDQPYVEVVRFSGTVKTWLT